MRFGFMRFTIGVALVACSPGDTSSDPSAAAGSGRPAETTGAPLPGDGSGQDAPGTGTGSGVTLPAGFSALQKKKAEMLTSIWENATTVLAYDFSQNNHDGYGYTSGRAGFTTGTGDALRVVRCYDQKFGTGAGNRMHAYVSALDALDRKFGQSGAVQGNTSTLDAIGDYNADWKASADDGATASAFNGCQDDIVFTADFVPAITLAKKSGLVSALAIAVLYDSVIVHGADGAAAIAEQANADTGNAADESTWLAAFLARRLRILRDSDAWTHSVDRAAVYEQLRRDANLDLGATIVTSAKAFEMFPNDGYTDSGYPSCVIAPNGAVSGDAECTR